jgi:hypothetical protein
MMMSFLIISRIKKYNLLTIQISWRNVCVFIFYNSFNIDFHLLYENSKNVKICFYVNTWLHVDHWLINYVFDDVCTICIKMTNNKWINVHNVYNVSFSFYKTRNALIVIEIVKNCLNDDEKHNLLKDFNLHHFLWNDATRSFQHDATNQLFDVVSQTQLKFIFFSNNIIWKTRHFQNTIDLIFMTKKLQEEFIHCMTRSKMNQNSNHISIFTKLMLIIKKNESRRRQAWKNMCKNKFSNNWRKVVASSSFNCVAQVEAYALEIQQCVLRSIEIFVSWANFFFEVKFFWNEKCAEAIMTTRRRRRKWIALHIEKTWKNYLKKSNEKKRIIAKKKDWIQTSFSHHLRHVVESLTLSSLSANSKSQIEKHVEDFESFTTKRWEQYSRNDNEFRIQNSIFINFFFQTRSRSISSTYRILIISTSSRNRRFLSQKMKFDKQSDDASQTTRQNLTIFRIAFSKYSLTS